jgi:hypothetical protein
MIVIMKLLPSDGMNIQDGAVIMSLRTSGVHRNFFRGGGSTNSVEDRGQKEQASGGISPLVRGSTQFANK